MTKHMTRHIPRQMTRRGIDYRKVFEIMPDVVMLLRPDLEILNVNHDLLEALGCKREEVLGENALEAFPARPNHPPYMPRPLRSAVDEVVASGEREVTNLIRYDVEDPGRPGVLEERYWSVIYTPVRGDVGQVSMVAFRAQEVTHIIFQDRAMRAQLG
jgi:PAS domain S-box-containing protein